jgi:hypothetical protein
MKVTKEFVEPYLKMGKRHTAYDTTVDIAHHLSFHFDGYVYRDVKRNGEKDNPYFTQLIDTRRPSESDHIKEYRRKIYLPITKQPCFKIVNSLKKIVKSPDWNINWSKSFKPAKIKEEEQLEVYCDTNLPIFNSVENWFYSYGLKEILTDPNGLICVLPTTYEVDNDEYRKPYPYFVNSCHVYDYMEGEYAVFRTNKSYDYKVGDITIKDFVVCVVTKEEIWEIVWVDGKENIAMTLVLDLNFKKMPAFRAGGVYKEIIDNSSIFESFVSPILPGLDAAAREISDLDAEVVQHIFTTMWYYASQGCASCNGTGSVLKAGKQTVCSSCEGNGVMVKSPYKDIVVKPGTLDEQTPKPPFAGHVEKDTAIVDIQDRRIDNHIFKALASINMEFLAQVPLSESGKAKEVDRDELNNFVYGVAYHSVENIIKKVYQYINEIRVMALSLSDKEKREMMPQIVIPERFEILSESYLQEQIGSARTAQVDPLIITTLELDFVSKKYENYPEIRDKIRTMKELDPFPTLTPEQKDAGIMSGTILKEDAMISKYMVSFVERAVNEDKEFLTKTYDEKLKVVEGYAQEKIKKGEEDQKKKDDEKMKLIKEQINVKPGATFKGA